MSGNDKEDDVERDDDDEFRMLLCGRNNAQAVS